ncbi:MAG: von Willebrand factor type [Acidobacteria bacterium]|nr:von Willebrand factor type [Acidobacteriota bacterium]
MDLFAQHRRSRLLASIALALALLAGTVPIALRAQTPQDQDDVIRTETNLTNILLTATDKHNRLITNLREEDLRVLEDGVPQKLFTFQRETDRPLSIAFLIDVSASEERTLPDEKAAARTFIETIIRSTKDEAAIIPFTDYAYLEQALTRNVLGIYQALERVEVALPSYVGTGRPISGIASKPGGVASPREGSTAIWDAITVSAKEILARSPGLRRRAIILLTDGQDTSSRMTKNEAVDQALDAETVIYAIGIGDSRFEGVNRGVLNSLAESTGGRAFFPKKGTDLNAAFAEIEQELRSQYLLAYSSSNKNRNGAFRQTRVELVNTQLFKDPLKLRYRPGYFAKPLNSGR